VELLPRWLAPNLVTLIGFFFILGNVVLLEWYVPDLVGPVCYLGLGSGYKDWLTGGLGTELDIHKFWAGSVDVLDYG
jgi:hypothetical protein